VAELTDAELDDLIVAIGLSERGANGEPLKPCGTQAAYRRHIRRSETPCQPCKEAHAAERRDRYTAPSSADLPPIAHGTPKGARQHWYRKDPICKPCRDAYNAAQRKRHRSSRRHLTEKEWQARTAARRTS
jgi:hypothetical protein